MEQGGYHVFPAVQVNIRYEKGAIGGWHLFIEMKNSNDLIA